MLLSSGTVFVRIIFGGPPSLTQRIRGAYLISRSRISMRRSSARDAGPPPRLSWLKAGEPRICQSRPPLGAPVPPRAHPKGVAKKGVHLVTTRVIGSAKAVASLTSRGMAHVGGVGWLSILKVIIPSRVCSVAFMAPPRVPMASPLVLRVGGPPIMVHIRDLLGMVGMVDTANKPLGVRLRRRAAVRRLVQGLLPLLGRPVLTCRFTCFASLFAKACCHCWPPCCLLLCLMGPPLDLF